MIYLKTERIDLWHNKEELQTLITNLQKLLDNGEQNDAVVSGDDTFKLYLRLDTEAEGTVVE